MSTVRSAPWWAGIALAVAVSLAAGYAADFMGVSLLGFAKSPISPIMMAIVIGMVVANTVSLPASLVTGLRFCASTVLRVGIMLLGIRLSLVSAGTSALLALPFVLVAIAVGLTTVGLLGRNMGLSRQLSGLIAVGTSVCGVTAIVATAPIIEADQAEVSYSVACITVFGLAAMLAIYFVPLNLFWRATKSASEPVRRTGVLGITFVSGLFVFGLTVEFLNLSMAAAFYSFTVAVLLAACYNTHHGE